MAVSGNNIAPIGIAFSAYLSCVGRVDAPLAFA
jgi:hypothetical protein